MIRICNTNNVLEATVQFILGEHIKAYFKYAAGAPQRKIVLKSKGIRKGPALPGVY